MPLVSLLDSAKQQRVLLTIVDIITRMLHPICPFVTEAIWPHIQTYPKGTLEGVDLVESGLVASASWPDISTLIVEADEVDSFDRIKSLVTAIRIARSSSNVNPKRRIELYAPSGVFKFATDHGETIKQLAGLASIAESNKDTSGMAVPVDGETIYLDNMLDEQEKS